jgi:hypothetical protein
LPEVVLVQQGDAAGGGYVGREECLVVKLGALDQPDAGQPGDPRALAPLRRGQDDRDLLAVPERQLLDHSRGERVIPAYHEMIATGPRARFFAHERYPAKPGH